MKIEKLGPTGSDKMRIRYILKSIVNRPSPGIRCSCEDSGNLGQKFVRAGFDKKRKIKHGILGLWEIESVMKPQRWRCTYCENKFNHVYAFVEKWKKYADFCREMFSSTAVISSAAKATRLHGIPVRTGYTLFFDEFLPRKRKELEEKAIRQAREQGRCLTIDIDDTSTRKGKNYASYIYDTKLGSVLAVIKGRKYEELMDYQRQNHHLYELDPAVIAMDRAPTYTKFALSEFPNALIVFDRFHIIKNIRDLTLHPPLKVTLRDKRFASTIKELLLDLLWKNYREELSDQERNILNELPSCSEKLKNKYEYITDLLAFYKKKEKFFPRDFFVFRWHLSCHLHREWVDCMYKELENWKYLSRIKGFVKDALKKKHRGLLPESKRLLLEKIFHLADWHKLGEAYEFIEDVGKWYDTDYPTFTEAYNNLHALIGVGLQHDHKNIRKGAESLQRGQQSIANYHRGDKATNALIEGKNCATKLDFRQRFGVRIWRNYENLAIVCRNSHLENDQGVNCRNVS
ncbi:transposase [Pasteuria penetrans]|uniref:transposase n=1 Tax=Pasteuria penetrans TaxID=86005 RepID=UPI0011EC4640|nr:transposase [Pasteuria penetrans]